MNVERVHAIVNVLSDELRAGPVDLLQQLTTALQQTVNEPQQPGHQQEVSRLRAELADSLAKSPSDHFSPAWREALRELGAAEDVGAGLALRIEEVFSRNEITLAAASEEIGSIFSEVRELNEALTNLRAGLDFLKIGAEKLAPGDFEVGFLIPRGAVENELGGLGQEFSDIKRILGPFLEVSTGTRPAVEIRSIASSEFQVLVDSAPATALMIATAIERIISAYEKVMNIRLARQKLKDAGVAEETLSSVSGEAEGSMERDIETIADELLDGADQTDSGRVNELRKELRGSLGALANRIDHGFSLEVRAGELPPPPDEDDESDDPYDPELRETTERVLAKQEQLRFANLTGDPILQLPDGHDTKSEGGS